MKKRAMSALLIATLVFTLIAGCQGSPTASETPAQASEAAPTQSAAAATESAPAETQALPSESEAGELSTGGVTADYDIPLSDDLYTLSLWMAWPPFLQGAYDPNDNPFFAEMEKALNVSLDITVVSTETTKETFNLMIAGGDWTDMIQGGVNNYVGGGQKAIDDDVFMDLAPVIKDYAPRIQAKLEENPTARRVLLNDEGCIPQIMGFYTEEYYTDQGFWVRQDWLDELNLSVPETYDELTAVLKAFKTEKNATDPMIVINSSAGLATFLPNIVTTAYKGANLSVADGQVQYGYVTDGARKSVEYMNMLYNEGLINSDFISYTESQVKPPEDVVYGNNGGMFNEDVNSISAYVNSATQDNPDFYLSPVAAVVENKGDKLDNGYIPQLINTMYAVSITTTCERPDIAIRYFDYLHTDEGVTLSNWGTEGTTYNVDASGNKQYTDAVLNDPNLPFQLAQVVMINPGFPAVKDLNVQKLSYNDAQLAAVDVWSSVFDSYDGTYPADTMTYTSDESDTIAQYQTEVQTYVNEMLLKFVVGNEPINDETWSNYVQTANGLGIPQMLEVYQTAYERYMSK